MEENIDLIYKHMEIQKNKQGFVYENRSIHMYDISLAETGKCATAEQPGEDFWIRKELSDKIKE
jgi:hypothetical protein